MAGCELRRQRQEQYAPRLSSVEDIRREMDAVIKLDEGFQAGSAYLGLGQLYLQAPRMLGGDRQKAVDYLEKGLRFGKDNALLRLRLAEAYHQINRDADALKQIDYLLSMKIDPAFGAEYKEAVEKAQKLRSELRGRLASRSEEETGKIRKRYMCRPCGRRSASTSIIRSEPG